MFLCRLKFMRVQCFLVAKNHLRALRFNGRFYTRGRIICLDELGETFVVRDEQRKMIPPNG